MFYLDKKNNIVNNKGSLLFELLIIISLLVIILSISTNAIFLSLKSSKISKEKEMASSLAHESLEAVRSVIDEDWSNIFNLNKNGEHYYVSISGNKWVILSGDENLNINNSNYTRYITINNVSRDFSTRNIQSVYSSSDNDPSTQKITVNVSWAEDGNLSISEYFFRWKNRVCDQSGWAIGGSGNTVIDCIDTNYDTKDPEVDVSTGSIKLQ